MKVSFEYKEKRSSDFYIKKQKIIKERKIIGKRRTRKRVKKQMITERRVDRTPTKAERRTHNLPRKQQTITEKYFTHHKETIEEEVIEQQPTIEILSIQHVDLNEHIDVKVPVMDIEFHSAQTEEMIPNMVEVISPELIESRQKLSNNTVVIDDLKSTITKLESTIKELNSNILVYRDASRQYRFKMAHMDRAIRFFKLKLTLIINKCKCNLRLDDNKIHEMINKEIASENENFTDDGL